MKKCEQCEVEFDYATHLDICSSCIKEQEQGAALVNKLMQEGHTYHCSFRQVWGDGECECKEYKRGYKPYAWTEV